MGLYSENQNTLDNIVIFADDMPGPGNDDDDSMPELINLDDDEIPELEYGSPINPAEEDTIINNDEIPRFDLPFINFHYEEDNNENNFNSRILRERPYFISRFLHYNLQHVIQPNLRHNVQPNLQWDLQPNLHWDVQPDLQWNLQQNLQDNLQDNVHANLQPNL